MSSRKICWVTLLGSFFAVVFLVLAANRATAQTFEPMVALSGNHPAEMNALSPVARANPSAQLKMQVTLALRNRSALDQLIQDQQNPASPQYHKWLTPAQFAARFGPSQQDLDAVSQWVTAQGLQVTGASLAGRYVRFEGKVADAERAFGTQIMNFGDGTLYSNVTDPVIPARFSAIVSAVGGMDNFLHTQPGAALPAGPGANASTLSGPPALLDRGPQIPANTSLSSVPNVTIGAATAFGPSDFRSFYNENPLISAGLVGSECIGIVGTSNFTPGAINLFNSTFGLPPSFISTIFTDHSDPGTNGAQTEAHLDLEWSHAAAPGAGQRFYLGNDNTSSSNGAVVDSIEFAVNENQCGVISVSFSLCGGSSSFFTGVLSPIYAQAAAQGQAIFVSSGDWGAAGLVFSTTSHTCVVASTRTINEMGADPNVTNVGGTGFTPNFDPSGNNVGHVTESTWNDSFAHVGGHATGGGASSIYSKPSYQAGPGVPNDGKRDVPDVAMMASPYDPGAFLGDVNGFGTPVMTCCVGGTSLSTPLWAGIAKLIAQFNGARTGPLNPRIYAMANSGASTTGLRDVVTGNNTFNGVTGFSAGPGFDLTTGWGTPDITTFTNCYVTPSAPVISAVSNPIQVGSSFFISGHSFGPNSLVNFFVSTGTGPLNAGPLTPSGVTPTLMAVPVPASVTLGQGFVSAQVVNAGCDFKASNSAGALLQGSAAAGIPTITAINGQGLDATSDNPNYATNNVSIVLGQSSAVTLGGSGFDTTNGVVVLVFGAGGKLPDISLGPGSFSPNSLTFTLPSATPTGAISLVVVNRGGFKASNAVSAVAGASIKVNSVGRSGSTITVNGAGFSTQTVINFFNTRSGGVVNLGGIGAGGAPKIALTVVSSTMFTFTVPSGAASGASYVQALNPPFVPFSTSSGPGGAFTL